MKDGIELRVSETPNKRWHWRALRGGEFLIVGFDFPTRDAAVENARETFSGGFEKNVEFIGEEE